MSGFYKGSTAINHKGDKGLKLEAGRVSEEISIDKEEKIINDILKLISGLQVWHAKSLLNSAILKLDNAVVSCD